MRVGDVTACSMATPSGARDLVRLLGGSRASIQRSATPAGVWGDCAQALHAASVPVRTAAMRPLLGIVGLTADSTGGGSAGSDSTDVEWSQMPDGRHASVLIRREGAAGWLVEAIRLQNRCAACR